MGNQFRFSASHLEQAGSSAELEINEQQFVRAPLNYPFILLPSINFGPAMLI
jgi:hypothetical protein